MRLVARAGILCGALTIATSFSAAAEPGESVSDISPAEFALSAAASSSPGASQSVAAAPVNPLREFDTAPTSPDEPIFVAMQPSDPKVPNTGRVQLFRSTQKPATESAAPPANADGGAKPVTADKPAAATSAFPSGVPAALSGMVLREARFEDVARGPVLVPVTPPQPVKKDAPTAAQPRAETKPPATSAVDAKVTTPANNEKAPSPAPAKANSPRVAPPADTVTAKPPVENKAATSPATPTTSPESEFKRLPPVTRTGPPPLLRPGTKLPQEPILIYPATGK